ncbi:ornithine decarboxylase [Spirochaetia bacterium]|nr:ornithine decarboxylase [Spirochaetia bacterium]
MTNVDENVTPALVLDGEKLKTLIAEYKKIGDVYYPVKSNSAESIIEIVRKEGCGFLASCTYYLEKLIACGVEAKNILYDNCAAAKEEIAAVCKAGVNFFYTDSSEHFFEVEKYNPAARFLIKISADKTVKKVSKFGIQDFTELKQTIENKEKLAGLGFYIPESSFCYKSLKKQLDFIFRNIKQKEKIEKLNLGGSLKGLLTDPKQKKLLDHYKNMGYFDRIILEPGRNLLNPCMNIETTVIKKRILNGNHALFVDASIYSGLMDVYIEGKKLKIGEKDSLSKNSVSKEMLCQSYHIYGKTSDSADYLGVHRLSQSIKEGDILTIADCGAYCWDMSQVYSGAKKLTLVKLL